MIFALRFEWAWTKPNMSRRLHHVPKKKNMQGDKIHVLCSCNVQHAQDWSVEPLAFDYSMAETGI